ncbi:MAG: hypothetical protein VKJ24_19145 [Synechococcales bacterium]|nr:hypothetical protein [Synechococcales bacterium]
MATPIPIFSESLEAVSSSRASPVDPKNIFLGERNREAIVPFLDEGAQAELDQAAALLRHYSFEVGSFEWSAQEWDSREQHSRSWGNGEWGNRLTLENWANTYPAVWIRIAVIEALYQGRYKLVSVAQILEFWQRRQQPIPHFTHEFERLVSDRFPRNLLHPEQGSNPELEEPKPWIHAGTPAWINLAKQIQAERHALSMEFPV